MSRGASTVSRLSVAVTAETVARILHRRERARRQARRRRLALAALLGAAAAAAAAAYLRPSGGEE